MRNFSGKMSEVQYSILENIYPMTKNHELLEGDDIADISCGDTYISYGIQAKAEDGTVLETIDDIDVCKENITKLVMQCNKLVLELVHLNDVVEDYLVDYRG